MESADANRVHTLNGKRSSSRIPVRRFANRFSTYIPPPVQRFPVFLQKHVGSEAV